MILYRPVGLQELALLYDSGMKAFPARLPKQPIFYPVLQLEYARKTASDWNTKHEQFAGYVTQFKVEDQYISRFEKHAVGKSKHEEFWIPAEEMDAFNQQISGPIKVVEAYFGEAFQGFIPESFGLQGKNAVEQFNLLANSYIYKRMDFYLEIKRNHKAVFLNYPFWQKHDFKNPGLKEKVTQAIREAWFTSFPKTPLINPITEDPETVKQTDKHSPVNTVNKAVTPVKQREPRSPTKPAHEDASPVKPRNRPTFVNRVRDDNVPVEQAKSQPYVNPVDDEIVDVEPEPPSLADVARKDKSISAPVKAQSLINPVDDEIIDVEPELNSFTDIIRKDQAYSKQVEAQPRVNHLDEEIIDVEPEPSSLEDANHEEIARSEQIVSHFEQGIKFGLSGMYHEAIDDLSRAVEEDPRHIAAHTSLGVAYHRLGEDDRALACYETALKIDPNHPEAHYFRANILYNRGDIREAIAGYTIAMGLKPELIEAHQNPPPQDRLTDYTPTPAEVYRVAKPAYRILNFNRMLKTTPRQANLFKERAAEYSRLWNYKQAIADYNSFLNIQPDDAAVLHLRGLAYEQIGERDRALEDYQQAIRISPQLSDEYINRGVTFGKMGNFRQSIASLNEGIRLAPQNPDGYFNRGMTYFQLGDFENAIDDFSNVIQLSREDEAAYYWRGLSNEAAGHRRESITDYRQFLALSSDPRAREEVEQKLNQLNKGKPGAVNWQKLFSGNKQKAGPAEAERTNPDIDLYNLISALGERAMNSTWFGIGVVCEGEKADELYALIKRNRPVQGRDFLHITSGIRKTREGDFTAFDPDAVSHWLFIRAWSGNGFYIEINDPASKERLQAHFQGLEEVEGAYHPYESLFLPL